MDLLGQLHAGLGDRYDVERELGGGAMSRVFLARDRALGRRVVVKTLSPELASSMSMERFRREIEVCARLQHPHILPLLSADDTQEIPYFITPYVEGESLRTRLGRDRRIPVGLAVRVVRDVADALEYAHSQGVVHRDIKPGNILLAGDHAIVTDFGVAKVMLALAPQPRANEPLTGIGMSLGTPEYMAPEQALADPNADHRVDIYALGAVAYEMLCGRSPFGGRTSARTIAAQVMERPADLDATCPGVPADVAALVMRCLAKDPAQRPQRASEIVRALEGLMADIDGRPAHRHTWTIAMAITGALAIGAGLIAATTFIDQGTRARALTILRRQPAVLRPNSVVVAPFRNETGYPDLDPLGSYAAGAVAEGLLRLNRFVVVDSRSAVIADSVVARIPWPLRLVGRDRAVAREAGASVVISGRYYRDGATLRFQGQIAEVSSGKLLHALPEVSGPASDTRAVVAKVRERVVATMSQGSDTTLVVAMGQVTDPPSLEAYVAMQRGLIAFLRFDPGFAQYLRRAEALDSTYATPVVLQAMGVYRDQYDAAAAAIERADRLQDRMSPAEHALLEHARAQLQNDPESALRWAQEAMTLLPTSREPPLLVAGTALQLRQPRVAIAALERTEADRGLNLMSAYYWRHLAIAHHQLGAHQRALAAVRDGRRRFPRDDELARIEVGELVDLGRLEEVRAAIEQGESRTAHLRIATDAVGALAMSGRRADARAIAAAWLDRTARDRADTRLRVELDAQLYAMVDRWDRVRELVTPLLKSDTGRYASWDRAILGVVAAHQGNRRLSAAMDDTLRMSAGRWDFGRSEWLRARIAAHEGDEARAIQLLAASIEHGLRLHSTVDPFERDCWLEPLAGSPAFQRLRGIAR